MIPVIWANLGCSALVKVEICAPQLGAQTLSNETILFHSPSIICSYYYPDGSYMTHFIQMKGIFDPSLRIQWVELCTYKTVPGIEWPSLERVLCNRSISSKLFEKLNNDKTANKSNADDNSTDYSESMKELRSHFSVFDSGSVTGPSGEFQRLLQVSDVMSALSELLVYQKTTEIKSPIEAFNSYINNAQRQGHPSSTGDHNSSLQLQTDNSVADAASTAATPVPTAVRPTKQISTNENPAFLKTENVSPGCSPHDTMKQATERARIKRKRSNKNGIWQAQDPAPSVEGSDRAIPGTKKIRF